MTSSHSPQLCAPRDLPPPVGSQRIFLSKSFVAFSTSSTLQSHGGLYAQFFQSFSTWVPFCTLTGFNEMVPLILAANFMVEIESAIDSDSVMYGGLSKT